MPLWRRLIVSSTAANASMPTAFASDPPSNPRRLGILHDEIEDGRAGVVVVGAHDHVAVDGVVEVAEGGGRNVVERGRDPGAWGTAACIASVSDPSSGQHWMELAVDLVSPLAIATTTFPDSASAC